MFPEVIKKFLIKQKKKQGYFCIEIDENLNILRYFGVATEMGLTLPKLGKPINEFLPVLLTESFDNNFEIPFYNISNNHVCHIYFIKSKLISYLLLIDKSEIFQVTQKYQQFAHDDNIAKNKFKRLSEELEIAQNELKKSNQEKATLIAMLSHEIGTPLTSILGFTELLLEKSINIKKGLTIINRNAVYLQQMIQNTLIYGSDEAGGSQKKLEEINLLEFFSVIKTLMLPSATSKNLEIQVSYSKDCNIYIDETRTKQILINLLNNAVKYTNEGFIELKFSIKDKHYIFSVIDSGIGVPENKQNNIFQPWERVQESTSKGSGIGLYISKKIANSIQAELSLKYSSKEFGSIFQLKIPIEEKAQLLEINQKNTLNICQGKSILIIDDDSDILDLIDAFLYSSGLKIYTALNIDSALTILKNNPIDLVLTDYFLNDVKSDKYLNQFKSKLNLPVILMTALPDFQLKNQCRLNGFDSIVSKPINSNKLIQTIIQFLTPKI